MENVTPLQFWIGIITILVPNIYLAYNAFLTYRSNIAASKAQALVEVNKADTDAQDRLFIEYDRQITNLRRVEDENKELRPLALKNAILERDIASCREDKEDWKSYAKLLARQLEEEGHVPLPFRRTPSDGDTQERIATIKKDTPPDQLQTIAPIKEE